MNIWLLIAAIILGAGSLFLITNPYKAEAARKRFAGWGNSCFQGMSSLLKRLPDTWRRTDIIPALESSLTIWPIRLQSGVLLTKSAG